VHTQNIYLLGTNEHGFIGIRSWWILAGFISVLCLSASSTQPLVYCATVCGSAQVVFCR